MQQLLLRCCSSGALVVHATHSLCKLHEVRFGTLLYLAGGAGDRLIVSGWLLTKRLCLVGSHFGTTEWMTIPYCC